MVRKLLVVMTVLAICAAIVGPIVPAQANTPIKIVCNGRTLVSDVAPVIQSGRTLVPFRVIFEALGATVGWDGAKNIVSGYRNEKAIILEIGKKTAWVNGPAVAIDVAPAIVSGRTMVPLRFIAESMGAEVGWDEATKTVTVNATLPTTPPIGGTYTFGGISDPVMLHPWLGSDTASSAIYGRTHWGLVRFNENNEPMNAIADRWEFNNATLTWRFWLNPNAKWHDGVPVTAKDVKTTFDFVMHADYDGPRRSNVSEIQEVVIIDDHTVDFKMKRIQANFLFNIGGGLIPHHILGHVPAKDHRGHAYSLNPTGNGPYMFHRWVSGQYVELLRNPNHFQGSQPYIEKVVIRTYPDLNVMQAAFENGDIDSFAALQTDHIDRITREMANRAYFKEVPNHGYDYICINQVHPILSDLAVRQALVIGLNRQAMVDTVLDKRGVVIHSHQIPTTWATGAPGLNLYEHDIAKANKMLDDAGWKLGSDGIRVKDGKRLALSIISNSGNTIRFDISAMAASYWKRIGVDITEDVLEWSVVLDRFAKGTFDLLIIGWSLGLDPDPYPMFHSSQAMKNDAGVINGFNRMQYINAEVDKMLEAGRLTTDLNERRRLYQAVDVQLNKDLPYIFLFQRTNVTAFANRIQGVKWAPTGAIWGESWYIGK